ncbi:MAG: 30S ribosomal protein S17 [Actinomycetota bacterium]
MADEEIKETVNLEAQSVEDAPESEAVVEETPEAVVEDAPESEAVVEETPEAVAEVLHPKVRRKQERGRNSGPARTPRDPAQRAAERSAVRAAKAAARRTGRIKARAKAAERRASAPASEPLAPVEHSVGQPKVRQGLVISDKADKTITVRIDTARRHRRYEKIVRSSTTLHAHDETNNAKAGDTVRVVESRPLSRLKRWRLVEVVERAR